MIKLSKTIVLSMLVGIMLVSCDNANGNGEKSTENNQASEQIAKLSDDLNKMSNQISNLSSTVNSVNEKISNVDKTVSNISRDIRTLSKEVKNIGGANKKQQPKADPNKVYNIAIGNSVVKGNPNAKVTIIEWMDFQ